MDAKKTADEIIGGRRLTREDDWQFLLDAPLEELTQSGIMWQRSRLVFYY